MTKTMFLFAFTIILLITSCGGGSSDDPLGICIHTYEEPVLTILDVETFETGAQVSQVTLGNIKINDKTASIDTLLIESFNATKLGDDLLCDVPCGFGTEEGAYSFTVSAAGHQPLDIVQDASYHIFVGGCPSYSDGGSEIIITLNQI